MDTVIWSPLVDMNIIRPDSVVVDPSSTTSYVATVYRKTNLAGQNRWSCPVAIPFDVTVQNVAQIITSSTDLSCTSDGTATVSVSSGIGPYSYSWSNGNTTVSPASSHSITGLSSGIYQVTVADLGTVNTCDTVASIFVYPGIAAPDVFILNRTDATCVGANDAHATASVMNGTAPFDYVWTGPIAVPSSTNVVNQTATNLIPGAYSVVTTDALGCTDTTTFQIVDPTPVSINVHTVTNPTCINGSTRLSDIGRI